MPSIVDINNRMQQSLELLDKFKEEAVNSNEEFLAKLNRSQLNKGKDGNNKDIQPEYSAAYAKKKGFSTPDLKATGAFYNGITARYGIPDKNSYSMDSFDDKTQKLTTRYGADVLKLQKSSEAEAMPVITSSFIKAWKKYVKIKG